MQTAPDFKLIAQSDSGSEVDHQTPVAQRRTILTVDSTTCRWPIGDPRLTGFYFCGAHTHGATAYCKRHAQIAVRPASSSPMKLKIV